jgi:hypothetical protein
MARSTEQLMQDAIHHLTRKKKLFIPYGSFSEWFENEQPTIVEKEVKYIDYIFAGILDRFLLRNIYLSNDSIEDIIFDAILSKNAKNFVPFVESQIRKRGLTKDSIVIFPLHGFGILTDDFLTAKFTSRKPYIKFDNTWILSQSNKYEDTVKQIKKYLKVNNYPYRKTFEDWLIAHYKDSRDLKWLENNHLLIFKFKFAQVSRYDPVRIILRKLDHLTTKLYFLSALYDKRNKKRRGWNTFTGNNWETLDISHFLTITTINKKVKTECIGFVENLSLVFEKTFMNVNLPEFHSLTSQQTKLFKSIDRLFDGIEKYSQHNSQSLLQYARLSRSLSFFRKAKKATTLEDKIVFINTAFECLLLDNMENKKFKKMKSRIWKALSSTTKSRRNFIDVIKQRNNIVHAGKSADKTTDLVDIFYIYCKLVLFLEKNISKIQGDQWSGFYDSL